MPFWREAVGIVRGGLENAAYFGSGVRWKVSVKGSKLGEKFSNVLSMCWKSTCPMDPGLGAGNALELVLNWCSEGMMRSIMRSTCRMSQ